MHQRLLITALSALLSGLSVAPAAARYTYFAPQGSYTVEVSLENAKDRLRLPIYRNAITSLAVLGDWAILGTSAGEGLAPFLAAVSLESRKLEKVLDLADRLPGQRTLQSGFARVGEALYAGTMPDAKGGSGRLVKVTFDGSEFQVQDLGVAVAGEGIFALTADPQRRVLYGMTAPGGILFSYDLAGSEVKLWRETALTKRDLGRAHEYGIEPEDLIARALVVDRQGRVYGSRPENRLFRLDPASGQLETLPDELPIVWGRRPLGRVDSWAVAPDGMLYGGNAADGQLFRLDPSSGRVVNLGKPIMMNRMKGLAFGGDGLLYGVAGAPPGYAHLFAYDPQNGGFKDLGNPSSQMLAPEIAENITWRGFNFATVTVSPDGRWLLLGEEESQSQLMIFPTGQVPEDWAPGRNPTD